MTRRADQVFLLSPANSAGVRGTQLRDQLRASPEGSRGPTLGEAFARISALYFRGKLTYAEHFGRASQDIHPVQIITPSRGLLPASHPVDVDLLDEFAATRLDATNPAYRGALEAGLHQLTEVFYRPGQLVFLGSLATPKYKDVLLHVVGDRVHTPPGFKGMGNLQRGSVLLRAVEAKTPLPIAPLSEVLADADRSPLG